MVKSPIINTLFRIKTGTVWRESGHTDRHRSDRLSDRQRLPL